MSWKWIAAIGLAAVCAVVRNAPAQEPARPAAFDGGADARADLAAARTAAAAKNKRVLVAWGTNGHAASEALAERLRTDSALKRELLYEYQLVRVDVGPLHARTVRHADLAAELGAATAPSALPYVSLLAADGAVLAGSSAAELGAAELLALLKEHEAEPLVARDQLAAALAEARAANKHLFLGFDAPW